MFAWGVDNCFNTLLTSSKFEPPLPITTPGRATSKITLITVKERSMSTRTTWAFNNWLRGSDEVDNPQERGRHRFWIAMPTGLPRKGIA